MEIRYRERYLACGHSFYCEENITMSYPSYKNKFIAFDTIQFKRLITPDAYKIEELNKYNFREPFIDFPERYNVLILRNPNDIQIDGRDITYFCMIDVLEKIVHPISTSISRNFDSNHYHEELLHHCRLCNLMHEDDKLYLKNGIYSYAPNTALS